MDYLLKARVGSNGRERRNTTTLCSSLSLEHKPPAPPPEEVSALRVGRCSGRGISDSLSLSLSPRLWNTSRTVADDLRDGTIWAVDFCMAVASTHHVGFQVSNGSQSGNFSRSFNNSFYSGVRWVNLPCGS